MKHAPRLALLIFLLIVSTHTFRGQDQRSTLASRELADVHLAGASLVFVLDELAQTYKLPIGVDEGGSEACTVRENLDIRFSSITVEALMNYLITKSDNCQWEISDDVVNFFPKTGRSSLAETIIRDFSIRKGESRADIRKSIVEADEVSRLLTSQNRRLAYFLATMSEEQPIDREFELVKSDKTVRSILNSIAKHSKFFFWGLFGSQSPDNRVFLRF